MNEPRMYYFGPWGEPGHYLFDESGCWAHRAEALIPWNGKIDGVLQVNAEKGYSRKASEEPEGVALLHHKDGWTALSFWDRSVDTRGACNSTYFAEGTFTFEQMVEMAKTRFAPRWNTMKFQVTLAKKAD